MKYKQAQSLMGLFMIVLILTLPIYSAQGLAANIQITQNSGQAGIPGFIDAKGDIWTVKTLISGADTITPQQLKIKIGNNEAPFSSCTDSPTGKVCEYISPLTDGVLENQHLFRVVYQPGTTEMGSNSDTISADGSAPYFKDYAVRQDGANIVLSLKVTDQYTAASRPAVGLKQIDIVDTENNAVLFTKTFPEPGVKEYDFSTDSITNGILPQNFNTEGRKNLKIVAQDWLGHAKTEYLPGFKVDFVAPVISDYFNLTDLGDFIGNVVVTSDLEVAVSETNGVKSVRAYSEQAELDGEEAVFFDEDEETGLLYYRWNDVRILPNSNTISIKVVAEDEYGNTAEKTFTKTFVVDTVKPTIQYFGSDRVYLDRSYITTAAQTIILIATDQGSWISKDNIKANLNALGGTTYQTPDDCVQTEAAFICYWHTAKSFSSSGTARVSLTEFSDRAGNSGALPEVELVQDLTGPKVAELEIYGSGAIDVKNYFQSNDKLKIVLTAYESSGLLILVNLNDLVMDAALKYPQDYVQKGLPAEAGWRVFTQDECAADQEGRWICELYTDEIKSGPEKSVDFQVRVTDTAGNDAEQWLKEPTNVQGQKGVYNLDLLGLSTEIAPDYWEVKPSYPRPVLKFVDLDVAKLNYARMPLQLQLQSDNSRARALSLELVDCSSNDTMAPALSRSLLYGSSYPDGVSEPSTNLILEFKPFEARDYFPVQEDFSTATVDYTCQLVIYSKIGEQALEYPELQTVTVTVPFAYSTLGSVDENLKEKIQAIWDETFMEIADVLSVIDTIFGYLKWISNIVTVIVSFDQFINLVSGEMRYNADITQGFFPGLSAAFSGTCLTVQESNSNGWGFIEWIQVPMQILSCNPNIEFKGESLDLSWYGFWQGNVLNTYNMLSLRNSFGIPATSLYDNIYTSMAGLCVPGIISNLNKLREINCREIVCYGREVPQGIATMKGCEQQHDLQICQFWAGPAFDFVALGALTELGNTLKNALTSPLGLIKASEVIACAITCWTEGGSAPLLACKLTTGLNQITTIVNSVVSMYDSPPWAETGSNSYFCDIAEDINLDELAGGS